MRFEKYIKSVYEVKVCDYIVELLYEATVVSGGNVDTNFTVPMANREKYRKLNPKTNRMKNRKRLRYYNTDIPPEERSFENLPRYADKKPICRFQDWLCIKQDEEFSRSGATGGKASDGKWYGWSHRAVYGFESGMEVKKGHIAIDSKRTLPYKIKDDSDAKWHAILFSREIS